MNAQRIDLGFDKSQTVAAIEKRRLQMAKILDFNFNNLPVRIVDQSGEPWFVAKDICDILKLENSRKATSSLPDDEKNTVTISDGIPGNPNTTIINEQGLYRLIFKSRVPAAEEFKTWMVKDILPAIRKTGNYSLKDKSNSNVDIRSIDDKLTVEFPLSDYLKMQSQLIYTQSLLIETFEHASVNNEMTEKQRVTYELAKTDLLSAEEMSKITGGRVDIMQLFKDRADIKRNLDF